MSGGIEKKLQADRTFVPDVSPNGIDRRAVCRECVVPDQCFKNAGYLSCGIHLWLVFVHIDITPNPHLLPWLDLYFGSTQKARRARQPFGPSFRIHIEPCHHPELAELKAQLASESQKIALFANVTAPAPLMIPGGIGVH